MHVLVGILILLSLTVSAQAKPEFFAEAVAFGAKDCLFCHTEPGGGRTWNDRGHWLMARKAESGEENIAVAWLSDYVAPTTPASEPPTPAEGAALEERNVPKTYHRGPFFEPVSNEASLQRWIDTRGKYTTAGGEWPQYSGDVASSKYSPLEQITSANVSDLEVAWVWDAFDNSNYIKPGSSPTRQPSRAERARFPDGFKATPLMVGGKLFVRTNFSGVAAIDPVSGSTLWTYDPGTAAWGRPGIFGFATRGLGYWSDGDESRILLCTGDSYLVALDPATGKPIESFGDNGPVPI